jgi:hypothetical protein
VEGKWLENQQTKMNSTLELKMEDSWVQQSRMNHKPIKVLFLIKLKLMQEDLTVAQYLRRKENQSQECKILKKFSARKSINS